MNGPLHVTARFVAKPDQIDALHVLLTGLLNPTRAEDGCLRYELLRNQAAPAEFMMVECWRDRAALDTHLATPDLEHAKSQFDALLVEPLDLKLWDGVD